MTTTLKHTLMATTAIAVLGFAFAPGAAKAFDNVDWQWDKEVSEQVEKTVNVTIDTSPSGMLELQKFQWHVGDVTATSTVTDIQNNAAGEEGGGGQAQISETLDIEAVFDGNAANNPFIEDGITVSNANLTGDNADGNVDITDETVFLTFDIDGLVDVVPSEARDAADLPQVDSIATALGNTQTINSDVSMELHDGQFLVGSVNGGEGNGLEIGQGAEELASYDPDGRNFHSDMALALGYANAVGLTQAANIDATSTVADITNARVDSAATALGNNMSATLEAVTADDAFAIADVTQYAHANVNATSDVSAVTADNYSGFGAANMGPAADTQVPFVSSAATAVGNNLAITVNSPDVSGVNGGS